MDEDSHTAFRPHHSPAPGTTSDARSPARASSLADTRARQTTARVSDELLLDAARQCVLAVGLRRATLAEIARTAKVSRMTLYRRFPDVRSVLSALMAREFGTLLHRATEEGAGAPTARERLVRGATAAVRLLNEDQLMRTVTDIDTELLMPFVVDRFGSTQRIGEQVITTHLLDGHRDGSIRTGDLPAQARTIMLLVQSFVLSLRPATADLDAARLLDELSRMLHATLRS